MGIHKSLTDTLMPELGTWPRSLISRNICLELSVQCLCSVTHLTKSTVEHEVNNHFSSTEAIVEYLAVSKAICE